MPELILSAFSDEYAESLERQCEALAKFGIGYMEIRRADGKNVSEFTGSEAERVRKTLDAWGIRISSVGSPLGKTLPSEVSEEQIERVFTTAEILGAKYVRVFSFYLPEGAAPEQCRGQVIAGLEYTGKALHAVSIFCGFSAENSAASLTWAILCWTGTTHGMPMSC